MGVQPATPAPNAPPIPSVALPPAIADEEQVGYTIGIFGPPGGGKTTALRNLARGKSKVVEGSPKRVLYMDLKGNPGAIDGFIDMNHWLIKRPVTFMGAPGFPWQCAALWNTGVMVSPVPNFYAADPRYANMAPILYDELAGRFEDALHLTFSFGKDRHIPDKENNLGGQVTQELLEGRMPVIINRLQHGGVDWKSTAHAGLLGVAEAVTVFTPGAREIRRLTCCVARPSSSSRLAPLSMTLSSAL